MLSGREAIEGLAHAMATWPGIGGLVAALAPLIADALIGIVAGAIVLAAVTVAKKAVGKTAATT